MILVDKLRTQHPKNAKVASLGKLWCHMLPLMPWDYGNIIELHEVARAIGMKITWFQNEKDKMPHYDLVPTRREAALKLPNVRECTDEELVGILKTNRAFRRSRQ